MKNIFLLFSLLFIISCSDKSQIDKKELPQSGAGIAMDFWAFARSYPNTTINTAKWAEEYEAHTSQASERDDDANWEALGPKNIGGRMLCIAFHPTEENTFYSGSASGGLWKTTTAGAGYVGWERIPINFPVLGIPAIVINPDNPDEMYIGTGEVYNNQMTMPGVVDRFTRGSYGIGILKTEDGGLTWEKSLDWTYQNMTGVADLVMNPNNSNEIYAATSEGLYKTVDAGDNWVNILDIPMASHLAINPENPNIIFATFGSYKNTDTGVYRSIDGGENFTLLDNGLPTEYSGKTRIKIFPANPNILYCSMADYTQSGNIASHGLYKSIDNGDSWLLVNNTNIPKYQGWYAHDVAVHPTDDATAIWAGIDAYKTTNSGQNLTQKSFWYNWDFGQTPVGGSEGPGDYVHADIHAVYYHPTQENTIYLATDGGIFVSTDNGENYEGRNGSLQTQQFYANFSSSATTPDIAIGGLQDNATAIYLGGDSWFRAIGGDGMSAAVHPTNENILYGSVYNLNIRKSTNGGQNFSNVSPPEANNEFTNFNSPFEIAPSNPEVIYGGAQHLFRSNNGGTSWTSTSTGFVDDFNPILTIGLSPTDENLIYVSTSTSPYITNPEPGKVLRSQDGGDTWTAMEGLPDRLCMDIAVHPTNAQYAYAVFSGFGTPHVYMTSDSGETWSPLLSGLPDVPTNAVVYDPDYPQFVYIANDLGVYLIQGADSPTSSGEAYQTGLPGAVMAVSLDVQKSERKLRVATHGNGVWESEMILPVSIENTVASNNSLNIYPNPAVDLTTISFDLEERKEVFFRLIDVSGKTIQSKNLGIFQAGKVIEEINLENIPKGNYFVEIRSDNWKQTKALILQ